jgi:hypothetical protein
MPIQLHLAFLSALPRLCSLCYIYLLTFTLPISLLSDPATGKAVGLVLAHLSNLGNETASIGLMAAVCPHLGMGAQSALR